MGIRQLTVRPLSRREALTLLSAGGAGWMVAGMASVHAQSARPLCAVRPEQTEGPYFVDKQLNRSDIRTDPTSGRVSAGTPLALTLQVSRLERSGCRPLAGATVDVWHCDSQGVYSGVQDLRFNTRGEKFLRGYQLTDAQGRARFVTIYPGGYRGRTVHIHFKVRTAGRDSREFTSQLYFDDALTARIHSQAPYTDNPLRVTRNDEDRIFRSNGAQLMLDTASNEAGYAASFPLALDLS